MQPVSANDLITEALEEIRATAAGDVLNPTDQAKGLSVLNRQIDTYNAGRGNIFTERIDTWTLTINQQTYTIGIDPSGVATANFAAVRPVRLTRANWLMPATGGAAVIRRKINLLDKAQWAAKALQNTPGIPIDLYCDYADPLATYAFFMTPDQAYVIETYSWQQGGAVPPTIATGTLSTAGTAVTGTGFTSAQQGAGILINGVTYVVALYNSPTSLTLATSAGTQTAVPYTTGGVASLIVVPPAYYEYHLYSLAIRLAGPFGATVAPSTTQLWKDAKEAVQALNARSPRIRSNGDVPNDQDGLYNYLSGLTDDE